MSRISSLMCEYSQIEHQIKTEKPEGKDLIKIIKRQNFVAENVLHCIETKYVTADCIKAIEKNLHDV